MHPFYNEIQKNKRHNENCDNPNGDSDIDDYSNEIQNKSYDDIKMNEDKKMKKKKKKKKDGCSQKNDDIDDDGENDNDSNDQIGNSNIRHENNVEVIIIREDNCMLNVHCIFPLRTIM